METRKITVVQTKNQRKSVIMSAAATLGELKADLRSNGIDYEGMTFFEGTSKTELRVDEAVLPHDVPYKGQITNELVFMLTNTNKKIKSGAIPLSRLDAYKAIRSMGLQDACVKRFGKNFTMCKTTDLILLVNEAKETKKETTKANTEKVSAKTHSNNKYTDEEARGAISKLVDILEAAGVIEKWEKGEILDIIGGKVIVASTSEYNPKSTSPYSDDEIDDMFSGMNID